eukprot:4498379-Pyramimonas_sp.AAC.1
MILRAAGQRPGQRQTLGRTHDGDLMVPARAGQLERNWVVRAEVQPVDNAVFGPAEEPRDHEAADAHACRSARGLRGRSNRRLRRL